MGQLALGEKFSRDGSTRLDRDAILRRDTECRDQLFLGPLDIFAGPCVNANQLAHFNKRRAEHLGAGL